MFLCFFFFTGGLLIFVVVRFKREIDVCLNSCLCIQAKCRTCSHIESKGRGYVHWGRT